MNPDLLDIRPLMDARTLEAAREIARDPAVMGMNPANLGRSADAREALQEALGLLAETRAAAEARIDGGRLALACVLADLGRGEEAKQAAEGAPGRPELRRVYERLLEATTDAERRAARSALPMP